MVNTKQINYNLTPVKTAGYSANSWEMVLCDTTGGGFTVVFPLSPKNGDRVNITDVNNSFSSANKLIVDPNGNNIVNQPTNFELVVKQTSYTFIFVTGYGWLLLDQSPSGVFTGNLTQGSVPFVNGSGLLTEDNPNLFYDDTNNRLGVGTNIPTASLQVYRTSGTTQPMGKFEAAVAGYTGTVLTAENTLGKSSTYNLFEAATDSDGDAGGRTVEFLIRGDGNVGINTTTPNAKLQVVGDISVRAGTNLTQVTSDPSKSILINTNIGSPLAIETLTGANAGVHLNDYTGGGYGGFSISKSGVVQALITGGSLQNSFILSKLGIGTNNPDRRLSIAEYSGGNNNTIQSLLELYSYTAALTLGTAYGSSILFTTATSSGLNKYPQAEIIGKKFWESDADNTGGLLFNTYTSGNAKNTLALHDGKVAIGKGAERTDLYTALLVENEGVNNVTIAARSGGTSTLELFQGGYGTTNGISWINNGSSGFSSYAIVSDGFKVFLRRASYDVGLGTDLTTAWTDLLTVNDSAYLGVGRNTPSCPLDVQENSTSGSNGVAIFRNQGTSGNLFGIRIVFPAIAPGDTTSYFINCADSGTNRFYVYSNGNVVNTNGSYGAISDINLKDNVVDATSKLDKLLQVRVVNYSLKSDPNQTKLLGIVAQELEQIFPSLIEECSTEKEVPVLDENGNQKLKEDGTVITEKVTEKYKTAKYSVFVPILIKALQEEDTKVKALETRVANLESELSSLKQLLISKGVI